MEDSCNEKESGDVQILSCKLGFPHPDDILYDMWANLSSSLAQAPVWDQDLRESLEAWVFEIPKSFSEKAWYDCVIAWGLGKLVNFKASRWPEQFVLERLPEVSNEIF